MTGGVDGSSADDDLDLHLLLVAVFRKMTSQDRKQLIAEGTLPLQVWYGYTLR